MGLAGQGLNDFSDFFLTFAQKCAIFPCLLACSSYVFPWLSGNDGREFFQYSFVSIGLILWLPINLCRNRKLKLFQSVPHLSCFIPQLVMYYNFSLRSSTPCRGHFLASVAFKLLAWQFSINSSQTTSNFLNVHTWACRTILWSSIICFVFNRFKLLYLSQPTKHPTRTTINKREVTSSSNLKFQRCQPS